MGRRPLDPHEEADVLERAIARRKWIYRNNLYAKVRLQMCNVRKSAHGEMQHVASNAYTRYRPFPTPAQFAASPEHISRTTIFLRRELQVWPNLDIEVSPEFCAPITFTLLMPSSFSSRL